MKNLFFGAGAIFLLSLAYYFFIALPASQKAAQDSQIIYQQNKSQAIKDCQDLTNIAMQKTNNLTMGQLKQAEDFGMQSCMRQLGFDYPSN